MANSSMIPTSLIGASHLGRYVLRPDGKDGVSFTLSMYDTAIPTGDGGTWVGYRLYERRPGGDRKGTVLFEARTVPPTPTKDPADLAKLILDTLAVGPGDLNPDPTEGYTAPQLEFATKWGRKLRETAQAKFGWQEKDLTKLRADLEIVYNHREDLKAHTRHQMRSGVIEVKARTKREAVQEMREAVRNHIASIPQFKVGETSRQVYCLYPHGAEQVIQVIRPQHPESPMGDALRFKARDLEEAKYTFGVITRGLEAPADPTTRYVPTVTKTATTEQAVSGSGGELPKVSPMFPGPGPAKPKAEDLFDNPIPKRPKTRGLPGGILRPDQGP